MSALQILPTLNCIVEVMAAPRCLCTSYLTLSRHFFSSSSLLRQLFFQKHMSG